MKINIDEFKVKNLKFLSDDLDRLKNDVDLRREDLKKNIDDFYFQILDQIEEKRRLNTQEIIEKFEGFKVQTNEPKPILYVYDFITTIKHYDQNLKKIQNQNEELEKFISLSTNGKIFELEDSFKFSFDPLNLDKVFRTISKLDKRLKL